MSADVRARAVTVLSWPGDAISADDGVVCVARENATDTLEVARAREDLTRGAFGWGEPGLDRHGLRVRLPGMGIENVSHSEYGRS